VIIGTTVQERCDALYTIVRTILIRANLEK